MRGGGWRAKDRSIDGRPFYRIVSFSAPKAVSVTSLNKMFRIPGFTSRRVLLKIFMHSRSESGRRVAVICHQSSLQNTEYRIHSYSTDLITTQHNEHIAKRNT